MRSPFLSITAALVAIFLSLNASADDMPQPVPLVQKWSVPSLITTDNDWSHVPGFVGYRGDKMTSKTGLNPQALTADGTDTAVCVFANQSKPNSFRSGGVAEFDGISDPAVAIKGSGSASAPFLLLNLDTRGKKNVGLGFTLRDLDGSANNAVQPVAFQFRTGTNGSFKDLPSAFTTDATTGPNEATQSTPVVVMLPELAWDRPHVQVRWITANAEGNDEWVGIDEIAVVGDDISVPPSSGEPSSTNSTKRKVEPLRSPRDAANQ